MKTRTNKIFLGPKLRQLRKEHGLTQTEMARALGLSVSYINLLENNQRSLSVQVLVRISEVYGVDWHELVSDDAPNRLAELRGILQDPIFENTRPDIQELRASLDHCPALAHGLVELYKSYRSLLELTLASRGSEKGEQETVLNVIPEATVHDLFRRNQNYFSALEEAAERFFEGAALEAGELYGYLKAQLLGRLGIGVETVSKAQLPDTLRFYDRSRKKVVLSETLDFPNRIFQLTHMFGLLEYDSAINEIIRTAKINEVRQQARCRVELANYFAAAVLMPYEAFLDEAESCRYDLDHLAARFGVSFEQVCHRVTTLQRAGRQGVPFFFLRIDKAGNVTKRFNATNFHLAEYGGACPKWDIHISFRTPGRILPQFVEMPDGSRFFTISRTVDRPTPDFQAQDHRLAITLGCKIEHARDLVYAGHFKIGAPEIFTKIGINCRLCPRHSCSQRAQQPIHMELPIDEHRRGQTRFES